jgi:hypothetical protein
VRYARLAQKLAHVLAQILAQQNGAMSGNAPIYGAIFGNAPIYGAVARGALGICASIFLLHFVNYFKLEHLNKSPIND